MLPRFLFFLVLPSPLAPAGPAEREVEARPGPIVVLFFADEMATGDISAYWDRSGNGDDGQLAPARHAAPRHLGARFPDAHCSHRRGSIPRHTLLTGRDWWGTD